MKWLLFGFIALLCLGGCGGGGSSSPDPAPAQNDLPAPSPSPMVTISGQITYDFIPLVTTPSIFDAFLNYSGTESRPVRGLIVEALLSDNEKASEESVVTNQNGQYSLRVPANTVIKIRVSAQLVESLTLSPEVEVIDNTNDRALYVLDGGLVNSGIVNSTRDLHASSGWTGDSYTEVRSAAPFAILDSIYEGMQFMRSVDASLTFPLLKVNWSEDNRPTEGDLTIGEIGTTYYDVATREIYLVGKEDLDTDEYDRSVILHEWGHYFKRVFSRSDSIGGAHSFIDLLDMRLAYSEGWATALSAIIQNNPVYGESHGSKQFSGSSFSLEEITAADPGWYSEDSISIIFYDLFDANNNGSDVINLGFLPIYDVLTTTEKETPFFISIFTFITALKQKYPAQIVAIDDLVNAQDIESTTMDELGSTETNSASSSYILPIYSDLPLDSAPINLCLTDDFGVKNKIGNRRFLKFSIPVEATYSLEANRSPVGVNSGDPDFYIYKEGGLIDSSTEDIVDFERLNRNFTNGNYLVSFGEYNFVGDISPRDSLYCYDIELKTL